MARFSENSVSQQLGTLENKSLPRLDNARISRGLSLDWAEMRQLRDQFWRGMNQVPYLQIERSRELLSSIDQGTIGRKVFTSTSKWREQNKDEAFSYLAAFRKPLTAHLEELQRAPTPSLTRVVSVILNEFPRSPERTLSLSRDVENRWERWGVVERDLLIRYGSREKIWQTSDPLGIELLDFERDFGGTRTECEGTVCGLIDARDQYVAIRDAIFLEHVNLVWASAGSYDRLMKIPDVRQEALIGLLYAIERYEPALGTQFSTYASSALKTFRTRSRHNFRDAAVAIPVERRASLQHIKRAHRQGHVDLNSVVSELKIPEEVARGLLVAARDRDELDSALIDSKQDLPEVSLTQDEIWKAFEKVQWALSEREYDVVTRHYGLYGEAETLSAIGQSYNPTLTRQRVQQIEAKAMEKIRNIMRKLFPE